MAQLALNVKTASFQRWFNVKDIESTLKWRYFNVVGPAAKSDRNAIFY